MEKEINMKLSYESDGKMEEEVNSSNTLDEKNKEKEEFFNTTQNSE